MSVGVPSPAAVPREATGALAVRIFGCFAAGYFMSYGLRSVNAVLAPDLIADIGLTHSQLGSLTSAYFLAFAAMQLPLGVWLDRFGPRRVNARGGGAGGSRPPAHRGGVPVTAAAARGR